MPGTEPTDDRTARFGALVQGPPELLQESLAEATLLVAAHADPSVDVNRYLDVLAGFAAACPAGDLDAVVHQLFDVEAFTGNSADYYAADNSYLDRVIDHRLGIPITLAVVLLDVARRGGVVLSGVGMPGHFLVRSDADDRPRFLDPFDRGRTLSVDECAARFHATQGEDAPFDISYLDPVDARAIVGRILANLRGIHMANRDSRNLEWVLRLRGLVPGASIRDRAERAGVLAAMGRYAEAADVLEALVPEATGPVVDQLAGQAKKLRARLN
ncbi:MAG TPA: transglutaminase-like domain-containing protein [Acidimicrobiales bacterium]|nr:transglutaminase-like domain-containing protein [Acidimicrobiales bacterium]